MTLRVLALLARHGVNKYADALEALKAFYARRLPETEREFIVIDNALSPSHRETLDENTTLLGASEQAREFSSWQTGLDCARERLVDFDFIHLATAAFRELYTSYIERFDVRMLSAVHGRAAAIGHIDRYDAPVKLFGRVSQSWIRSSFVFLPPTEVRLLGPLVSVAAGDALFSGDPARPFRPGAPIDAAYQAYILGWLTGEGTGQGVTWHSRFELTTEALPEFEAKTLAILNEHALALRLREQGCAVVDAIWLATTVGKLRAPRPLLGSFPDWRDQLAQRDVDAVAL